MISTQMKIYNYFTYGEKNSYGEPQISAEPVGTIKMAINILSQNVQTNVLYDSCSYIGLTTDAEVSNKYIIQFNEERLKVEYVNPNGRYKQVFMKKVG